MRHPKRTFTLLTLLTVITCSWATAQPCFDFAAMLTSSRANDVMQDNEYIPNGKETGNFYCNPLRLNGETLKYEAFSLESKGQLTLIKGAAGTCKTTEIPFYIYVRRNGKPVSIPGEELKTKYMNVEISRLLKFAQPGDQLVIEPVNQEDLGAKRILKLLEGGC